eukprot:CAMPEP_0114250138 /NCGR_PEP_ID=MMETSP0058-20121206/14536_1 /TAXON_ID=36894 /ORGANISM="Pyramimonas parkeae, CCMP726" /LENGTH=186 /DNA_ID=CAMNT_0001363771 /DNA_START=186 /DNA_END=746 /DNA_ORIENTATION=-
MLFGLFVTSNDAAELPDVAAAFALNPTRVTLFPNRYAWRPCSLVAETGGDVLNKACKMKSLQGTGATGRNRVNFGERDCVLELKNCVSGLCYSTREVTMLLPQDEVKRNNSSIFSSLEIISGASKLNWTPQGFSFEANTSKVALRYSTHTCAQFYSYHGRIGEQHCEEPIEAITDLDYGLATDVMC